MKTGIVQIIWSKPELIINPEQIQSPYYASAKMMPVGSIGEKALCFKGKRWGGGKSGNVMNASWRRLQNKRRSGKTIDTTRRIGKN